eukprot:g42527.t1
MPTPSSPSPSSTSASDRDPRSPSASSSFFSNPPPQASHFSPRFYACTCVSADVRPFVDWTEGQGGTALVVPTDWRKSPAWEKHVQDPHTVVLGFYLDGINAWRGIKEDNPHAITFTVLEILNLPFFLRADPRFTVICDIIPGPSKPKNLEPWLRPTIQDVEKHNFTVLFASADYEAHVLLLNHKMLCYHGCTKCVQVSEKVGDFYDWCAQHYRNPPRYRPERMPRTGAARPGSEENKEIKKPTCMASNGSRCWEKRNRQSRIWANLGSIFGTTRSLGYHSATTESPAPQHLSDPQAP